MATTPKSRNGFQLVGHLNGHTAPHTQRFQKASNVQGIRGRLFVGDPVVLGSAGTITRAPDASVSGGGNVGTGILGVAVGLFETVEGRPLTHRTLKYATTADAFWVDVITDPEAIYEAQLGATATQTQIGSLVYPAYDAENSAAGISGAGVGTVQGTTTQQGFRVIDLIEDEGRTNKTSAAQGRLRVTLAGAAFAAGNTTAI